jgi:MoaA/NifB/PqqE/SkfB family radical SAM enzyme
MKGTFTEIAIRLAKNALRYRLLKVTGKPGIPQALSLEVTHRCIAKCLMCNIWKIPSSVQDLAMEEWLNFLSSPLFTDLRELDITGGEPFLREDLVDLINGLLQLDLKRLRSIAITTNALLVNRVVEGVEQILKALRNRAIDLVIVCAMDAAGDLHDRIRNFKGAWPKLDKTIQGLMRLRETYPGLILGLKTTVLPMNMDELDGIVRYADDRGLFTIISPCIITEGRYLNLDKAEALVFQAAAVEKLKRFYDKQTSRWVYHGEKLIEYFERGVVKKPCSCGFNYFFVRNTGDVFPCPLMNLSLGNIGSTPVEDMLNSTKASWFRRRIGKHPPCRRCTEPGLERYGLPYEGLAYLSLLFRLGRKKFLELHEHMGLDKYMDA